MSFKTICSLFANEYINFDDYCRVYTEELLPDIIGEPMKGKWRIEVTFEPDPEELLQRLLK